MPTLSTHSDFQKVRFIPFCYLCGDRFSDTPGVDCDGDHVPPKKIFAETDRSAPLILKVHRMCHQNASEWDEITNELVSVLHDKDRKRQKLHKHIEPVNYEGSKTGALSGIPLERIIWRFVRAFHTALYGSFLPYENGGPILPPFPRGERNGEIIECPPIDPLFCSIIQVLRTARILGSIDQINCFNNSCRYICVWTQTDEGKTCCIFGLRICEWEKLSDSMNFPRRACVGMYFAESVPTNATCEPKGNVEFAGDDPFDPFLD